MAINKSKRLERRLRDGVGATGRGLHTLVNSVEKKLPPALVKKLRFIATVRNKLVHDLDYTRIDDRSGFVRACDEAERELEALAGPGIRDSWRLTIVVAIVIALFLIVGITIAVAMLRNRGMPLDVHLLD